MSRDCREWVYFACVLDRAALRTRLRLPIGVREHEYLGSHYSEAGIVCIASCDGVMGRHPAAGHCVETFR